MGHPAKGVDEFEGLVGVGIVEGYCQASFGGHEVSLTFVPSDGWRKLSADGLCGAGWVRGFAWRRRFALDANAHILRSIYGPSGSP
jgi:hypothetical protein